MIKSRSFNIGCLFSHNLGQTIKENINDIDERFIHKRISKVGSI